MKKTEKRGNENEEHEQHNTKRTQRGEEQKRNEGPRFSILEGWGLFTHQSAVTIPSDNFP